MWEIKLVMALVFFSSSPTTEVPLQSFLQWQDRDRFTDFENSIRFLCREGRTCAQQNIRRALSFPGPLCGSHIGTGFSDQEICRCTGLGESIMKTRLFSYTKMNWHNSLVLLKKVRKLASL